MSIFATAVAGDPEDDDQDDAAQRHRDRMAARSRDQFSKVADIGEIPPVKSPKRREACRLNLELFLQTYFPDSTGLTPFSDDHRDVIPRIQRCGLEGGRKGNAVYRGFAKTTITENAAIWATLYGHRRYVAVFGCSGGAAGRMIDSIKAELQDNDLLYEDFPEVCHAIRALEGKSQRCHSQSYQGKLTQIEWTADKIVFPMIEGSAASGAAVSAHGLTSASRGLKHKRPDGTQQRPDWAIIDDPQTDESAVSPDQVRKRLDLIRKNILKLGGHRNAMACVINATVIAADDLVDQLMDPKKNPAWQWVRIPMVRTWSKRHEDLWLGEYARIRNTFDRTNEADQKRAWREATEFYRQQRAEMDDGMKVSWDSCFDPETEISSIQHAYNILIDDGPDVFASECQQEPRKPDDETDDLKPADIVAKCIGLPRGKVPIDCRMVTFFIDVQGKCLYWKAVAFGDGFRSHLLDYGVYPPQPHRSLALADVKKTLRMQHPGTGNDGATRAGLDALIKQLCARQFAREDGLALQADFGMVDSGNQATLIYEAVRHSEFRRMLIASKGEGVGPTSKPLTEHKPQQHEEVGLHWIRTTVGRVNPLLRYDTNWWKSFVRERITTAVGDVGSLTLFGRPDDHIELIPQLVAERSEKGSGRGREVHVWDRRPNFRDNHLWDCLIGTFVAASHKKLLATALQSPRRKKKKLTAEEIRARREGRK